jgi:hypothetical protein
MYTSAHLKDNDDLAPAKESEQRIFKIAGIF